MTFSASLDDLSKFVTLAVLAVAVFLGFLSSAGTFISIWLPGFLIAVFFISFLLKPVEYRLGRDTLVIHRLIKPVRIEKTAVINIRQLEKEETTGILRTFGSGGFFGYYGYFWSRQLGKFSMYATRRDNLVLIETGAGKKFVLSPDDAEMVQAVKKEWRLP